MALKQQQPIADRDFCDAYHCATQPFVWVAMEMTMEEKLIVAVSGFPEPYDLNRSNTKKPHQSALRDEWTGELKICRLQPQLCYKLDIGHNRT